IIGTVLKSLCIINSHNSPPSFEDPRTNRYSEWLDASPDRNYQIYTPLLGSIFFDSPEERHRLGLRNYSIFEALTFFPIVHLLIYLFERMGVESLSMAVAEKDEVVLNGPRLRILAYAYSIYTLAAFCIIAAPNISVGIINCNK
ncbi:hypothetical protein TrLO_g536, partial [Triparma laevis f. longispina]